MNQVRARDTLLTIEHLHVNCARNFAAYKGIVRNIALVERNNFWRVAANSAYDAYVIDWSKLLGSAGDRTHHRRCVERGIQNIDKLLAVAKVSFEDWKVINSDFRNYRNNDVAHSNLDLPDGVAPFLQKSLDILVLSYEAFVEHNDMKNKNITAEISVHLALT